MGFLDDDNFDARNVVIEDRGFAPAPEGWYDVQIHSAEFKKTNDDGERLSVRLDITGPTHQGKVIFLNITTANGRSNPDSAAVKIGQEQYAKLVKAVDRPTARKSNIEIIFGRQLKVKLKVEPERVVETRTGSGEVIKKTYEASNRVVDFAELAGASVPKLGVVSNNSQPKPAGVPPIFLKK